MSELQSHETHTPITIVCRDCGDVEMQFPLMADTGNALRRSRCDECQAQYDEERNRAARANVNRLLDMHIMRQPEEVPILCQECGEEVGSFVGYADHLDGKAGVCPGCGSIGKIVVGDDEGSAWIRFRAYTARELSMMVPIERVDAAELCERYPEPKR